ncbi:MAG: SDR family oxidoreductase [Caldilineaceae bacterium]|nr:SDR family oxidoreductase [Caldilineaceae bacterium]
MPRKSTVWTVADMPDLGGKLIVVTGANSGIGLEETKEFSRRGAQVIMACRNREKAQAALDALEAEVPAARAQVMPLDLSSLASIHEFARAFKQAYTRLDILVNNAGIMMTPYGTTQDGFELQLGTNHLGHFALTGLLLDALLAAPGSRVVTVSSMVHTQGNMDFDNLMYANGAGYGPTRAYGRSKLANLLFAYELQRRLTAVGAKTISVAAYPGLAATNLSTHLSERNWYMRLSVSILPFLAQSSAMGALPVLRAAVDPAVQGGDYYGPGGFAGMRGYPVRVKSSAASHNQADAKRLWRVSEELTGVRYLDELPAG